MGATRTGVDIAILVFGILTFILTVSLYGVTGSISAKIADHGAASQVILSLQFGVASWYLLTSVFAIVSGATGHKCPYIGVIVLSVFAILIAIVGVVLGALYIWSAAYEAVINGDPDIFPYPGGVTFSPFGPMTTFDPSKFADEIRDAIAGLPYGVLLINILSFILMIVVSSLGCCGACCNGPPPPVAYAPGSTTVVTTSSGYSSVPPGYVSQPPNQQFHPNNAINNPNYGDNNPYKS